MLQRLITVSIHARSNERAIQAMVATLQAALPFQSTPVQMNGRYVAAGIRYAVSGVFQSTPVQMNGRYP